MLQGFPLSSSGREAHTPSGVHREDQVSLRHKRKTFAFRTRNGWMQGNGEGGSRDGGGTALELTTSGYNQADMGVRTGLAAGIGISKPSIAFIH